KAGRQPTLPRTVTCAAPAAQREVPDGTGRSHSHRLPHLEPGKVPGRASLLRKPWHPLSVHGAGPRGDREVGEQPSVAPGGALEMRLSRKGAGDLTRR